MVFMKTTVLIDDEVYRKLVDESIRKHGNAKNISLTLNELLHKKLTTDASMFGTLPRFSLKDLRDKDDRAS